MRARQAWFPQVELAALKGDAKWQDAANLLLEANVLPTLRVQGVKLHRSTIVVELEAAHEDTPVHPCELPVNLELIQRLGLTKNQVHPYHLTLGYCHCAEQKGAAIPALLESERAALEVVVREVLSGVLPLMPARLCRFDDMTQFTEWNGVQEA